MRPNNLSIGGAAPRQVYLNSWWLDQNQFRSHDEQSSLRRGAGRVCHGATGSLAPHTSPREGMRQSHFTQRGEWHPGLESLFRAKPARARSFYTVTSCLAQQGHACLASPTSTRTALRSTQLRPRTEYDDDGSSPARAL